MLTPSGAAPITWTSAPYDRRTSPLSPLPAPWAASSTTRDHAAHRARRSGARRATLRDRMPRRSRRGRPRGCGGVTGGAVEQRFDLGLLRAGQLAATRREDLDAVVGERVVAGRGSPRHPTGDATAATAGVGSTPNSPTRAPAEAAPAPSPPRASDRSDAVRPITSVSVPTDTQHGPDPGPVLRSVRCWRPREFRRYQSGAMPVLSAPGSALGVLRCLTPS